MTDVMTAAVPPLDLMDTGTGLKLQTSAPHLVSLGSGRLSVAITLLPLKEGVTRIGREDAPVPQDITIEGPGIEAEHCRIENRGGRITLDPCGHQCCLDGVPVLRPTLLTQVIMTWVEAQRPGADGVNIITSDFVELVDFANTVIRLNDLLLQERCPSDRQ